MLLLDLLIFVIILASAFLLERMGIVKQALLIKDATLANVRVMSNRKASDHWKEKYLRRNSVRTFGYSMKLTLLIALFLAAITVPLYIIDLVKPDWDVFHYLITWRGIIVSILPFIAYAFLRKLIKKKD